MARESFEREIRQLKDQLLEMGSMVEHAILESTAALKGRDVPASRKVFETDAEINRRRFHIEEQTMIAIATQQPMAKDLRLLASILEVTGELERIGDYAKGIAQINIRMGNEPLVKPLVDIPKMADLAADMLKRALQAFIEGDERTAMAIPAQDDDVDGLYQQVYRDLMVIVAKDPQTVERVNWLLWVAHNLERAADRVTNICERTAFVATGKLVEVGAGKLKE